MATIALFAPCNTAATVFAPRHFSRMAAIGTFVDARFTALPAETMAQLGEVDVLVSTWGMPPVDEALLALAPRVRGIFYAAGSVKGFVTPALWARGITVSSAATVNAIPVAEYTVAVIVLSNKRFWQVMRQPGQAMPAGEPRGNYRRTVGIIGASLVGRAVMRLLQSYDLEVLLYDPFVDAAEAARLNVQQTTLPELMARADVVSLHAPNLPHLRHMIDATLLASMQNGATFINTARGALVNEQALLREVSSGRIHAVLDVTDPEPPVADSPFYTLPNVIYTPHIAGSMAQECQRMVDFALDELERFLAGAPLCNPIVPAALDMLA